MKSDIFTPSEELITFADELSKTYESLSTGVYKSSQGKYEAKIYEDAGLLAVPSFKFAQICHNSLVIELDKKTLGDITPNFVFFLIIWFISKRGIETLGHSISNEKADAETIKYYSTTGRYLSDIFEGYLQMLSDTPSNNNRMRKITALLTP